MAGTPQFLTVIVLGKTRWFGLGVWGPRVAGRDGGHLKCVNKGLKLLFGEALTIPMWPAAPPNAFKKTSDLSMARRV